MISTVIEIIGFLGTIVLFVFTVGKFYQKIMDTVVALKSQIESSSKKQEEDKKEMTQQIEKLKSLKGEETRWVVDQHTQQISNLTGQMQNHVSNMGDMKSSIIKMQGAVEHIAKWVDRQDSKQK